MATPKLRTVLTTATIILLAVIILFSSTGITAVAASRALPGDNLYGLKTGMERTRLNMTSQDSKRVSLNLKYAGLRLNEIERLIDKGRFDDLPEAIGVYELYIKHAIEGLEVVSVNDPQAALQLNSQLTQLLSQSAAAMANYSSALPTSAKTPLDGAIEFSKSAGSYKRELEFTGTVKAIQGGYWTIGGHTIAITEATEIEDSIRIGDKVEVEAWVDMQGNIYAEEIEYYDDMDDDMDDDDDDDMDDFPKSDDAYKGKLEYTGTVEAIQGGSWTIGGFTVIITEATEMEGNIRVGDEVKVEAWVDMYGNIYAEEIEYYNDMDDDMDYDYDDDDDYDDDYDDDMDDDYDDDDDDMDDDYDDDDDDDDDDMDDDYDDDDDDDDDD